MSNSTKQCTRKHGNLDIMFCTYTKKFMEEVKLYRPYFLELSWHLKPKPHLWFKELVREIDLYGKPVFHCHRSV